MYHLLIVNMFLKVAYPKISWKSHWKVIYIKKLCFFISWTARSMERSIFFFLKNHISAPGERNCPNFFFYGSFPIIFSCYKWVLSRLGPLHGQNWRNVSKKCLFGCPRPKSLKMTKIAPLTQAIWNKKTNFSQFSGLSRLVQMTGKLSKSNFI